MTIYIDILLLINFLFDFIILLSVSVLLKRKTKIIRVIIASLLGSISIFILFINLNNFISFLIKLIMGILIVLICYGYKNTKYFFNNIFYCFLNSIALGGFLYFISSKLNPLIGKIYYLNYIILVIFSPAVIYIYTKACLKIKNNYSLIYNVDVYINRKIVSLTSFYDTGNNLVDPYKKREVIIAERGLFKTFNLNYILVPCETAGGKILLKCFRPDKIYIKNLGWVYDVLVGLDDISINIDGVNSLMNRRIIDENKRIFKKDVK